MLQSMLSAIISILLAICGHMFVDVSDAYMACESCGEKWRVTSMVQCDACHSYVCPICVDSYAYTCGDTGMCFCCDDDAPMGVLPDDYDYDAYEGI